MDEYYCVNKNCNVSQLQNSVILKIQEYDRAVPVNLEVNCQDFVELVVYRLSCDRLRYSSRRYHKEEKIKDGERGGGIKLPLKRSVLKNKLPGL